MDDKNEKDIEKKEKQEGEKQEKKIEKKSKNIEKKIKKSKNQKDNEPAPIKPLSDFKLIDAIRGHKQGDIEGEKALHKANTKTRNIKVRKFIEKNVKTGSKTKIFPGQIVMFNYFLPKTREQLQYYDAMPCTIFFGFINTQEGKRVLGFNLHYYPPKIRYQVLDKIFEIFKSSYLKSWDKSLTHEIPEFNYHFLIEQLKKHGLEFGVREYIPQLMHKVTPDRKSVV